MMGNSGDGAGILSVTVTSSGPVTLVAISGEVDVSGRDELSAALDSALTVGAATVVIDLTGLRFMDSSALHVMLRAARALQHGGGALVLAGPQPQVARMLDLTAADKVVRIAGSVAEAIG